MRSRQTHLARRSVIAAACGAGLLVSLAVQRPAGAADPACALAVTVEGVPQGAALAERLTAIAQREGACSARSWALRVAPGPKGTYVVALWNGTELETRFASQPEGEPVASVLLRVALERQGRATSPDAPTASSVAPADSASGGSAPPPTDAKQPSSLAISLGPELGPSASNAGFGGEIGLLGFLHGRHLGGGLFGRYGSQSRAAQSRSAFDAGALAALGTPLGRRVWLAGVIELGLTVQHANGAADGDEASVSASGATVGGGVLALVTPTPHLSFGARLLGRWSSPSAEARDVSVTTSKNPGNGKGNGQGQGQGVGPNKTTTTTAVDPASQNAVDALGGGAVSLVLSVGYAF